MHQPWPCVTNASRRHSSQIGRMHFGHGPLMRRFTTTFEQEAHTDRELTVLRSPRRDALGSTRMSGPADLK